MILVPLQAGTDPASIKKLEATIATRFQMYIKQMGVRRTVRHAQVRPADENGIMALVVLDERRSLANLFGLVRKSFEVSFGLAFRDGCPRLFVHRRVSGPTANHAEIVLGEHTEYCTNPNETLARALAQATA